MGSGYRSISVRAIGDIRVAGIRLPGNGRRVSGSWIRTGSSEKSPLRIAIVGTVITFATPDLWE